jgi:hypothetical protein
MFGNKKSLANYGKAYLLLSGWQDLATYAYSLIYQFIADTISSKGTVWGTYYFDAFGVI